MSNLKLVFAGTPAFAASHLQALLDAGHHIAGVYTQPDRAAGRGKKLHASDVKQVAESHQLPVFQPATLKDPTAQAELGSLDADLMIVVAYGLLLPQAVLDTPRLGCINVHASLLPRWRGAAPIERAILAGDTKTGITIMQMDIGLDTGDMLYTLETGVDDQDDRVTLENRLAALGAKALLHTLAHYPALAASASKQDDSLSNYARKLEKSEALVNWQESAIQINRTIRAGIGRHPAYTFLAGERIRFLRATADSSTSMSAPPGTILGQQKSADGSIAMQIACTEGVLNLMEIQLPGKNPVPVHAVLNSRRELFAPGQRFSATETDCL